MEHIQQVFQKQKKSVEWYLRALWGESFVLRELLVDSENTIPVSYVSDEDIFLPSSVHLSNCESSYYRAAACHAAAHMIYGIQPLEIGDLNLMQRSVIGLVEDLRIELLTIREFPGLRKLWLSFHDEAEGSCAGAQALLLSLSRMVLDPDCQDKDHWVNKGRQQILNLVKNENSSETVRAVGLALANDLGQMRLPLNSGRYEQAVLYRDDNRCLWEKQQEHHQSGDNLKSQSEMSSTNTRLVEQPGGIIIPLAHNAGSSNDGYELRQDKGDDLIYRETRNESTESRLLYPEWDYRTHVYKQKWCTVIEQHPATGSPRTITKIYQRYKSVLNRLQRIARSLYTEKLQRERKLKDGDEIDYDPMLNAMVSIRGGQVPDTRVFMRDSMKQYKDIAVSIVLDLSESTNDYLPGTDQPVCEILRDSVLLLGEALTLAGDPFAINGFCSNSRHEVMIKNYKSFIEPFRETRQRLSSIKGSYSTRLGAAIRHCARQLAVQPQRKKLLLVITDGVPSDIDVFDHEYLRKDSWHAIHELDSYLIKAFCINLDSRADKTIENIFGKQRYETLSDISRLPEVLSRVYFRTTR